MPTLLPQHDPNRAARHAWLERNREQYRYKYDKIAPAAVSESFPRTEWITPGYIGRRLVATWRLIPNMIASRLRLRGKPIASAEDFERLFVTLPKPPVVASWRTDGTFARHRTAGANPMRLRRVRHSDEVPFDLGAGGPTTVIPGSDLTVERARDAGRLYLADYSDFASIGGGTYAGEQHYLPAPSALFHARQTTGELAPAGIALHPGRTVRRPDDAATLEWLIAKLAVQVADSNDLEMGSHLSRTHLVMEPFALATARQLGEPHPIGRLLRPHLRFMIAQLRLGNLILLRPGSLTDQLLAGAFEGSVELIKASYRGWDLMQHAFPSDLADRGLDDAELLPDCPYRDDGRLLWDAIATYVAAYVGLYYADESALAEDVELQAWATELAGQDGGRVSGMPARIETREQLATVLTIVLFTCGPQHALVNYGQWECLAFAPNMPLGSYRSVTDGRAFDTEADLLEFLPPAHAANRQLEAMSLLSAFRYDRLGQYDASAFDDPQAWNVIRSFQRRLAEIETTITERNRTRTAPYEFFLPSRVPNSISI